MKKINLVCSKLCNSDSNIEEDRKLIEENIFLIDGGLVSKLLENVLFDVYFDNNGIVSVIAQDKQLFEDDFNSTKWYEEIRKYSESILLNKKQVDIPQFLKDKYYLNEAYVSYIELIEDEKLNYCIARKIDNSDKLLIYSYGKEVHYGTIDEANFLKNYVENQPDSEGRKYDIYKIEKI